MLRFWFMHNFYNFFYKMLKAFFITSMYYCLITNRQGSDCLKKKPVLFLKTTFSLLFFKPWVSFEIAVSNLRYIAVRKVKYSCIKHIVIHEDSSFGLFPAAFISSENSQCQSSRMRLLYFLWNEDLCICICKPFRR